MQHSRIEYICSRFNQDTAGFEVLYLFPKTIWLAWGAHDVGISCKRGITYFMVEWQLKASHGFEPRSLDTKSRMRTLTPPDHWSRRPIYSSNPSEPSALLKPSYALNDSAMCFIGILAASSQAHHEQIIFTVFDSFRIANELDHCSIFSTEHGPLRGEHDVGISSACGITYRMAEWQTKASRGFEPRSLDSESRVLTVTPRGHLNLFQADTHVVHLMHWGHLHHWSHLTMCALKIRV